MKTNNKYLILLCFAISVWSCSDGDFNPKDNVILLTGTDINPVVTFPIEDTPSTYYVTSSTAYKVEKDVVVTYELNTDAVTTYNELNKTKYYAVPGESVVLLDTQDVIEAGKAASKGVRVQLVSTEDWVDGRTYVVPVSIKSVEGGNLNVLKSSKTILLRVSRKMDFYSLDVSNSNLYSNYDWERSEGKSAISLSRYTCEIKVFLTENAPARIRRLCNWGGVGQNMLRFGENGTDRNSLQWVCPAGNIVSKTLFSPNRWYTVSLTFDGTTYVMYVNGVKDSELVAASDFAFSFFEIGMSWAGYPSQQLVRGRIAEVKLWNKALVSSEIQMGMCGVDANSDGLIGYWKMNEGTGHMFYDSSPSQMHMDWSDTWREPSENGVSVNVDKSSYVTWIFDDYNSCNQ